MTNQIPTHLQSPHERALEISQRYKKSEAELLDIISQVREKKLYRYFECTSLFEYCVKILKLDPGVVYAFTTVAKKMTEVPELRTQIQEGTINVSTARRITPVLTSSNKQVWFQKAQDLTVRKLEKEVARVNPKMETKEKASYLNSKRIKLELGLSETSMLKLRQVQDLESQRQKRRISLEETLESMIEFFISKRDPVEKAKRAKIRGTTQDSQADQMKTATRQDLCCKTTKAQQGSEQFKPAGFRKPIPTALIHEVNLRDKRECQHRNSHTKEICHNRSFLEIHHRILVSQGGQNTINNLITLCSEHHKQEHMNLG